MPETVDQRAERAVLSAQLGVLIDERRPFDEAAVETYLTYRRAKIALEEHDLKIAEIAQRLSAMSGHLPAVNG